MGEVSTIGLDIAKSGFQVHGADVDGAVVIPEAHHPSEAVGVLRGPAALPRRH
jgi:hypothetical protein